MSTELEPEVVFDFPPIPESLDFKSLGDNVTGWVRKTMPYDRDCKVLSAEESYKQGRAICYGQALGCVALLEEWEVPAGICLTNTPLHHATALSIVPEASRKIESFIFYEPDAVGGVTYRDTIEQSEWLIESNYGMLAYNLLERLPDAMTTKNFCFNAIQDDADGEWKISESFAIREGRKLNKHTRAFTITDADSGEQMFNSIGLLKNLFYNNRALYDENYHNLIQDIPDFVYFPEPRGHESL